MNATAETAFEEDIWPGDDEAQEAPPPLPADTTVPLNLLDEGGEDNVRSSASKAEIESLMASILHRGLLQALVVAEIGGRYRVGAGNRRLRALKLANKQGFIPKDHPVGVRFARPEDLHEISLTENVMRVALHPVDEFEAFRDLRDDGLTIAQIADRFGLKEKAVRQRLALGGLAPVVLKAWRDGKIGQEQAQSFTICDDHDIQRQALDAGLKNKAHWNSWEVDRILKADRVAARSGSFAFVGREAYLAAGGLLREDLFGDVVLVESPDILRTLVAERRRRVADELVSVQGWAFAVFRDEVDSPWAWSTLPLDRWMTDEERAALTGKSSTSPAAWTVKRDLIARVSETREARALSGVILDISHAGDLTMEPLRLRPAETDADAGVDEDDEAGAGASDDDGDHPDEVEAAAPAEADTAGLTKALEEDLSEQLSDAIAACLVADPVLALRATVAALTSSGYGSPLKLSRHGSPNRKDHRDAVFADCFRELGALDHDALLTELARALSPALDIRPVQIGYDPKLPAGRDRLILEIVPEDFRSAIQKSFKALEFFERASAAVSKQAVSESRGHSVGGKKSDVVGVAIAAAAETGWLPGPLRTAHYVAPVPAAGGAA